MKRAFKTVFAVFGGTVVIAGVALLANHFKDHVLFAPIVYGAIVVMVGVFYGIYRHAQRQTVQDQGG